MESGNNLVPNYVKNKSKNYSKHLVEYFLLKIDHLYVLGLLLTISIFFFLYREGEKIPQTYLIEILVLGIIGIVLCAGVGIHHWIKNRSREKDLTTVGNLDPKSDSIETYLKMSQFIITIIFLLAVVIICAIKINKGNISKSLTYGIAIPSLTIFLFTLFVFIYSFYSVAERSYRVGIRRSVLGQAQTASQIRKI
jgi:magnesium-transporting ATPase (P-type)